MSERRPPRKQASRKPDPRKPAGAGAPPRAPRILSAREGALRLLAGVLGEEARVLTDQREAPWMRAMTPEDRARALRLAAGVLRFLPNCDAVLSPFLRHPPDLPIRNVLRLGTFELCTGAAAHGVVNESVRLAERQPRGAHAKGMVNAVLRRVSEQGPARWPNLSAPALPDWLRLPLAEAWGEARVTAFEAAHAAGAPLDLTAATADPAALADLATRLGASLLPTGSLRLAEGGQVSALPGFETGEWWVQDAAAAIAARALAPRSGEAVLDLCAAPGGKTLQLAAAGTQVTAVDVSDRRLNRLRDNLRRTGLDAQVIAGDALDQEGQFDAVLLDAPCSATGTIRRHPDLPHARDGAEIGDLIALQARMLAHAMTLVKPGGRLVYCTCSLIPDEGECQVEEALGAHPGWRADPRALTDLPGIDATWTTEEGGLRLTPDLWSEIGGMDGFYIACLRRD
ncbi:RsmB/NOP family class I SAM-dependent RNA methyltransferase [Pseudooceanicola aestuarii]|uniref:RsmB/NOP family class I SAM-dependent RNA methyltransferase n=1 Tax=Pseudooceanicola aestuarii TaxID=2697319 RepID=UPI0013D6BACD|nr:RsmB/NOP family class I SAM-dependent RNA methyltransferase [Pseudooceanicola aestuarii]